MMNKKNWLLVFMSLIMMMSISMVSANDNFTYVVENDTVRITGYNQSALGYDDLVIPDLIEGFPVTVIDDFAFSNHGFTGSLVLPQFLKEIRNSAFTANSYGVFGFSGELVLPSSLEVIENQAFHSNQFSGDLVIPEGLLVLSGLNGIFSYNNFNGTVYLPGSIQSVGQNVFSNNIIREVVFSENYSANIGWGMFMGNNLTSVNLPENSYDIDLYGFRNNFLSGNLTINITGRLRGWTFRNNLLENVVLGEGVYRIERYEFYDNPTLISVAFLNKDVEFYLPLSGVHDQEIFNNNVTIIGHRYKSDDVTDSAVYTHASSRDHVTFVNIEGCTDPAANNYDEYSLIDDESCTYDEPVAPTGGGGGGGSFVEESRESDVGDDVIDDVDSRESYFDLSDSQKFMILLVFVLLAYLFLDNKSSRSKGRRRNKNYRRKKRR
jgi:hypothetical protein